MAAPEAQEPASFRRPASSHNYGLNQDPHAGRPNRDISCVSEEQDVGRPGHLTRTYSPRACFQAPRRDPL